MKTETTYFEDCCKLWHAKADALQALNAELLAALEKMADMAAQPSTFHAGEYGTALDLIAKAQQPTEAPEGSTGNITEEAP